MHATIILLTTFTTFLFSCDSYQDTNIVKAITHKKAEKKTIDYSSLKSGCKKLYTNLKSANDPQSEKQLIQFITDSLMSCWYGTKWNFYGTTEIPGEGSIACGYFVTTIIRDAGIPIQRVKLAQCASEEMIKKVCDIKSIKRYSNIDFSRFYHEINSTGFGLYVIGLDYHTGFIFNDGEKAWFIHSSYISPGCVLKEEARNSSILKDSKYRVIGKLKI